MTESEFIAELSEVLAGHSNDARSKLTLLLESLPKQATRLDLEIFPSQDGDGFFTIRASVHGPDLYVINKAIKSNAQLFDAKHKEDGVVPPIPIVNPFAVDYSVNDIVVDCAAKWLNGVWESLGTVSCSIPVQIIGHDDNGTATPIELHSGTAA
jgi:hypothetical protein